MLLKSRNAYGTLKVSNQDQYVSLTNGQTLHGFQPKGEHALDPSSYYGPESGLGLAIEWVRDKTDQDAGEGIDFGAIGLGVGTICSWCESNDTLRFFEINPAVEGIARAYFTYLENCEVTPEIVLGDARLQLEREVNQDGARQYDVLIADAFSSDSIPLHLLTLESMQIYKSRLKPNGVLAFHVSNRFLILENIVKVLALEIGMEAVVVDDDQEDNEIYNSSKWVLVTSDSSFIRSIVERGLNEDWPAARYSARWTDDYASIVPVIRWDKNSSWLYDLLKKKGWAKETTGDETTGDETTGDETTGDSDEDEPSTED